jgi:hypothetical protein
MSYIVAFIQLSERGDIYPVQCLRTDVAAGDEVLVQMAEKPVVVARVTDVAYLSWKCKGQIKGKVSEAQQREDGTWALRDCPSVVGLATNGVFVTQLKLRGWVPLKSTSIHSDALTYSNEAESANILLRQNGIDLQILSKRRAMPKPLVLPKDVISDSRFVRHYFSHTTFNLYEGILRFAESFMASEGNYDRFFTSVGRRDRRSEALKKASVKRQHAKSDGGSDDWRSDWCDGMDTWYEEMMERD